MTTRIPTSTSITETSVIPASLTEVWHLIKLQDFHQFWSKLSKSEYVKGASPETDIIKWTFKDGTEQEVKQEEHSVLEALSTSTCQVRNISNADVHCIDNRPLHHLLCHFFQSCSYLL